MFLINLVQMFVQSLEFIMIMVKKSMLFLHFVFSKKGYNRVVRQVNETVLSHWCLHFTLMLCLSILIRALHHVVFLSSFS